MSYKTLQEAAKAAILRTNFEVLPADWAKFKAIVSKDMPKGYRFIKTDDDEESLADAKEILIRFDMDDLKAYSDIDKADFFQTIHNKNIKRLTKYFK